MLSSLRFLLIFICLIISGQSYGQESIKDLETIGDSAVHKGITLYSSNKIDSAIYYTKKACDIYKEIQAWEKYVCTSNNLAFIYNHDNQFTAVKETSIRSYTVAKKYLLPERDCFIAAVSNMHHQYYILGDYNNAIKIFKETLSLFIQNNTNKLDIAINYNNLGSTYQSSGDYQNAFVYLNKALEVRRDTLPNSPIIGITYQNIGRVFQLNNQIDSAIHYFEKAEKLLVPIKADNPLISKKIQNYIFLAELWSQQQNTVKSNYYINESLKLPLDDYHQVLLKETIGITNYEQKKYRESASVLEETQILADKYKKHNTPPQKARRLITLASAFSLSKDYIKALYTYQEGLNTLSPEFQEKEFTSNPKPQQLLDKPDALSILNGKAETLYKLFEEDKKDQYLKAAYETYCVATDLISDIRQSILTVESKNSLATKTVPIYEGAIKCALILYNKTKEEKYKSEAFAHAESNKALLLLENINEQTAKGFAGISDSLLAQEKDLKLSLAFRQKQLLGKEKEDVSRNKIEDEIFVLRQQLDDLRETFEKDYPRYFELKYQNNPVKLQEAQLMLKKNENAILEYFVGEETIYLFILTADNLEIRTINSLDSVFLAINQLRAVLKSSPVGIPPLKAYTQFVTASHDLYLLLLKEAIGTLPNKVNRITIIPDDQLNFIPFDLLLTKAPNLKKPGYTLSDLDYLLEKYAVNYHYSATLLSKTQQRKKEPFEFGFLGFAPSFIEKKSVATRSCTSSELYSLKCSQEEIESINQIMDGAIFVDTEASKDNFQQNAAATRILHLATHACIDESDANSNKIFLTDDFLSGYDLYAMNLNADLAVLSACNTGSGELVKGEGVMSLARAFINAGCSSTLMSMWSVDDCATSDIMLAFYKGLKKNLPKELALQRAKLEYLRTASKSKLHPYYWGAFVQFGNTEAIKLENPLTSRLYWILGFVLLVAVYLFYRFK